MMGKDWMIGPLRRAGYALSKSEYRRLLYDPAVAREAATGVTKKKRPAASSSEPSVTSGISRAKPDHD